jgi:hypothetical protein
MLIFLNSESLIYDAVKVTPQISDLKQTYETCDRVKMKYKVILSQFKLIINFGLS